MSEPESITANNDVEVIDLTSLSDSSEPEGEQDDNDTNSDDDAEVRSEASEVEIMLTADTRAQLLTALYRVPEVQLRKILRNLLESDTYVEAVLTRELVETAATTAEVRETADDVGQSLWPTCVRCDENFSLKIDRVEGECIFHPGELYPNADALIDWEDRIRIDGPMDTLENREQYPEMFVWTCCEQIGIATGCVKSIHKAAASRKRKRLD